MAISTIGTKFSYGTSESSMTEVAIKTFADPIGSPEGLDATSMADTQYVSIPGLKGSTSSSDMTANYDSAVFAAIEALNETEVFQKLVFSDGTGFKWKGKLTVSMSDGSVNSVLEMVLHSFKSTDVDHITG